MTDQPPATSKTAAFAAELSAGQTAKPTPATAISKANAFLADLSTFNADTQKWVLGEVGLARGFEGKHPFIAGVIVGAMLGAIAVLVLVGVFHH